MRKSVTLYLRCHVLWLCVSSTLITIKRWMVAMMNKTTLTKMYVIEMFRRDAAEIAVRKRDNSWKVNVEATKTTVLDSSGPSHLVAARAWLSFSYRACIHNFWHIFQCLLKNVPSCETDSIPWRPHIVKQKAMTQFYGLFTNALRWVLLWCRFKWFILHERIL